MKLAIFGSRGFIGKELCSKASFKHQISTFDLPETDIRFPETYSQALISKKPDAIINLSALLGTMKESPSVVDLFETNVLGNLKVLREALRAGVKSYVFVSSITVHGENEIGKHQERFSFFNPKHPYSASKAAAELGMMQFVKEARGMAIVTVRPTMVLGKGTYLPHAPIEFIRKALAGETIELYGDGSHEREWIWIDDVVEGIIKAAEFGLSADAGYHPFFLTGNRISMRNVAEKIVQKLNGKLTITPATTQAFTLTANGKESEALLSWSPSYGMDAMIDALIKIERSL